MQNLRDCNGGSGSAIPPLPSGHKVAILPMSLVFVFRVVVRGSRDKSRSQVSASLAAL